MGEIILLFTNKATDDTSSCHSIDTPLSLCLTGDSTELATRYGHLHETMETAGSKLMLNALHSPLAEIQWHLQCAAEVPQSGRRACMCPQRYFPLALDIQLIICNPGLNIRPSHKI